MQRFIELMGKVDFLMLQTTRRSFKLAAYLLLISLLAGLLSAAPARTADAYVDALGQVLNASVSGDTLTLIIDNGSEPGEDFLEIQAASEKIIKFNYRPNGVVSSPSTPMIDPDKEWGPTGAVIDTAGDPITLSTPDVTVEIQRNPVRMTIKNADGTALLWEPSAGGVFHDGVRFLRSSQDNLYGIRGYGAMESEGELLRNNSEHPAHAGEQGDSGGPFIWSTAGYGLLVDSDGGYPYTSQASGKLEFYYGGTPVEGRRYEKNNVEYYVMIGDPYEIMGAYADITGKAPMLPKWSLGFMNFEWGTNQAETEHMVDQYRARNIPLDAYAIDYDWMRYGEDHYGEFRWNENNFPDSATQAWKNKMVSQGIKMVGIRKPRITTRDFHNNRTEQYDDAEAGDYWYPGHWEYTDYFIPVTVRSIDPYKPAARSWLWQQSQAAYDKGIVGWWNDETDKVSSGMAQYWFGNFMTAHWSQALYEGQRSLPSDNQRVWQTARTYYPGTQRYATTLWSGDIGIQFHQGEKIPWAVGMREQRPAMLSAINMGQAKWGMDAGGFNQQDGATDNPSPELYARWLQFSALTPVFRVHGNYNQQRQPWFYGTTAEEAAKSAIQLRYSLFPYMYAYERSAYENGVGLVRPLLFDYPQDPGAANRSDAWMFGDYLLAAPVVDKQQTVKAIELPPGTWTDYFRGTVHEGGQVIHYPLDAQSWTDIPLFIKQGAIIPSQPVMDYVGQKPLDTVTVDVFPDQVETSFTYFDDDGSSYDYENGAYFKQRFTAQQNGAAALITIEAKTGDYTPPDLSYYLVKLHGRAGSQVSLNGTPISSYAGLEQLKSAAGEGWAAGKDLYGDVTYIKVAAAGNTDKQLDVTGNSPGAATGVKYEAEEASLFGKTSATKASVSTVHSGYSGSGFVEGMHQEGAGVTFYADVRTGGDYEVDLRYGNGTGAGQTISIYVNGTRVRQTELSPLANWNSWASQAEVLPLTAGRNSITYQYDDAAGDSGNVNLDSITVPFEPLQAKYEAESAQLRGSASVNTNHWFYSGTGFVDGLEANGAEAVFTVYAPAAGTYQTELRYANGSGATRTISAYVNGIKEGQLSLTSPAMNWNIWSPHQRAVTLQEGFNTLSYKVDSGDSGGINLDRLLVSPAAIVPSASESNLLDNGGFERTAHNNNWTEWHPTGQALAFGVDGGSGINPPESPYAGSNRAYFYASGAYKQSIHQTIDVPENNTNYKLEAWVRLKNSTPFTARAEIMEHGGSPQFIDLQPGEQWKHIQMDPIYVSSGRIKVGFYIDSPGGTTLHIDEVRLTKQ